MRARSAATALLIAFVPIAVASRPIPAQADEDPVLKAARARFNEGVAFYDKGQYENARAAFLQAYALRKHPAVLLNLAQSDLHSGHTLEAARYFEQYLRESAALTTAQRGDAEKGLADARTKLGRIDVSAPAGVDVDVDGERVGTAPLAEPLDVEPGSHTVKSSDDSKTLTVVAGQTATAKLEEKPPAAAVVAPPSVATVSPAEAGGDAAHAKEAGGPGIFSPPKTMAPTWIGLGVGVAGGATAILFAVFKGQSRSNAESVSNQIMNAAAASGIPAQGLCSKPPSASFSQACQTLENDDNLTNTNATVANVGLGVGIAGLAFGLGWYLFAPKRDAAPKAASAHGTFVPIGGADGTGLGYAGSF